jgi:hypothetical protein
VTWELGQQIQNVDGLGLKIAILYFLALSPTALKHISAVGDSVKKNLTAVAEIADKISPMKIKI